jgi:hypothetical protein
VENLIVRESWRRVVAKSELHRTADTEKEPGDQEKVSGASTAPLAWKKEPSTVEEHYNRPNIAIDHTDRWNPNEPIDAGLIDSIVSKCSNGNYSKCGDGKGERAVHR